MLSSAAQPCCHIGRFHRHRRDAHATRKRPPGAGRRHQSCGRFAVISRQSPANHVGLSQLASAARGRSCAAVLSPRGVPLSAHSGQRGLTGRLDFAKTPGGAPRVFKLSLAGLLPRKGGSAFPPHRARVPLAALIPEPDRFHRADRPPLGFRLWGYRSRMRWSDFRASILSAIRSRGLAAKAILPRTFGLLQGCGHAQCMQPGGTTPLRLASPRGLYKAPIRSWVFGALPAQTCQ